MFVLEISFNDGISQPELVFVRRPQVLIGSSEYANVVVDDFASFGYEVRLVRGLGRSFSTVFLPLKEGVVLPDVGSGTFEGFGEIKTPELSIAITPLDIDLAVKDGETPDRAGVRILREAAGAYVEPFPAVLVRGGEPIVVSFMSGKPIYIGRSNKCAVRLDAPDVSSKHACVGLDSGGFWVEDLGSTNGTFLKGQQVSGKVPLESGIPVVLGREYSVVVVTSEAELNQGVNISSELIEKPSDRRYPVLISVSEVARPARVVLPDTGSIVIGRDTASDMWLGAPHISRRHCEVVMNNEDSATVLDQSTNGTAYDAGVLKKGERLQLEQQPRVLNFGGDITVGICFNSIQETAFLASHGALDVFLDEGADSNDAELPDNLVGTIMKEELGGTIAQVASASGKAKSGVFITAHFLWKEILTPQTKILIVMAIGLLLIFLAIAGMFIWQNYMAVV